ncbi:MAG: hypothetical protein ABI183_13995 [Polyangiaceae bacterium]
MMITKRQWTGFVLAAVVGIVPLAACSSSSSSGTGAGSFTCGSASKCPNDTPETADETALCKQTLAGPCAQQYQAYGDCVVDNQKCGSDGKTDSASISSCSAQLGPLMTCEQANADGGTD